MAQPEYAGGILRVASAGKTAEAMRQTDKDKVRLDGKSPEVVSLVGYLMGVWEQNRMHKEEESGVQEQMLRNLEAYNNEYSAAKKQEIAKAGMPDVYMGLTNVKCTHAISWLRDIFSSTDKPFGIRETPKPNPSLEAQETALKVLMQELKDHFQQGGQPLTEEGFAEALKAVEPLSEEVMDLEIRERTQKMETLIYDQLVEGGWDCAFDEFLQDLVTMKCGIIKGPVVRKHKQITYHERNGVTTQKVEIVDRPEFWRISPLDIYPSPTAEDVNDGSLVEKITLSRKDLIALKDEAGYDAKAINEVLENFGKMPEKYTTTSEETREDLENKSDSQVRFKEDVEGLEFWCSVQGKSLIEYGVDKIPGLKGKKIEPLEEYPINAIVVGTTLIYADLNDHPLGCRPYVKVGWRKVPGSFWAMGVPELMEDLQRVCNASARALCYNMSMASGPQVDVDIDRLVPGEDLESAYPGKVWQTQNRSNVSAPAVRFFNPNSNSAELFQVYENFARLADDYTGIPAYAYGSDRVAGAGRTSSGLSMLMSSAAKGIKSVILTIDKEVIKKIVRRQFEWNMQYSKDSGIKGDIDIVTTGAVAIMVKEQMSERRMQFLQTTQNDVDMQLLDMEGRANVLREAARSLEMENTKIVKSSDEVRDMMKSQAEQQEQQGMMEQQQLQMQMQAQQAQTQLQLQSLQLDNQLKQLQLQVEQSKIQLEHEKLRLEQQKLQLQGVKIQSDAQIKGRQADAAVRSSEASVRASDAKSAKTGIDMLNEAVQNTGEDEITQAEESMAAPNPNGIPESIKAGVRGEA